MIATALAPAAPDMAASAPFIDPSQLAADGTQRFATVTRHLHELRDMQTALVTDLEDYSGIVGEDDGASSTSIEDLGQASARMNSVLAAIAGRLGDENALQDFRDVQGYLHTVVRVSQSLGAISILTRTTAASNSITSLNGYLQELSRVASVIRDRADEVSDYAEDLSGRMAATKRQIGEARLAMGALDEAVTTATEEGSRVARDSGRATQTIQDNAATLTQAIKGKFKGFVNAIQFSDRLSQRLEHLTALLAHEDIHARRLAAAQARDIAGDLRANTAALQELLDGLGDLGRSSLDIFVSSEIAKEAERILGLRSQIIGEIAHRVDRTRQVLDSARNDVAVGKRLVAEAAAAFKSLEASSKTVGTASMNSTLLAARSGDARGPLAILSVSVRECASQCLAAVGGSESSLNALFARLADGMDELLAAGDLLEDALGTVRDSVVTGNERLERLNTLRSDAQRRADRILDLLTDAATSNDAMSAIVSQLEALADSVDRPEPQSAPDSELLATLWGYYTMDDEREVHLKMFGGEGMEQTAPQPVTDIDDLMF